MTCGIEIDIMDKQINRIGNACHGGHHMEMDVMDKQLRLDNIWPIWTDKVK